MIIFIAIVVEIATIIGSIAIKINGGFDSILEILKNGYKVDKKALKNFKNLTMNNNKKIKIPGLELVLILTPGINLLMAGIFNIGMKKNILNQMKDKLVPMTDDEKKQYAQMKTKYQKLVFMAIVSDKNDNEDFVGFIGKRPILVENGVTNLRYDKLVPLSYTFDEVKKLNEITNYSYRIGRVDNRNIAIIGIPNPDYEIKKVRFNLENENSPYTFDEFTDEDAECRRFLIYPFTDEKMDELVEYIEQIKKSRNDNMNSSIKENIVSTNIENHLVEGIDYSSKEQGPVLKKTLFK